MENSVIEHRYITLDCAKLLKQAGFHDLIKTWCHKTYSDERPDVSIWTSDRPEDHNELPEEKNHYKVYSCPTQAQACKWIRDNFNIHVEVTWTYNNDPAVTGDLSTVYVVCVNSPVSSLDIFETFDGDYEEAMDYGILLALKEIIKRKENGNQGK